MTTQPADGPDLVDRLVRCGLGHGAARCYVAMPAPRAFRVGEVARQAGPPRSRAYEPARSLVRWDHGQPPGETGEVRTAQAGEAVPGDDRQVRFPRPG
jgi:hypothetical protein